MYFADEILAIEHILEGLQERLSTSEPQDVGKMQIFIEAYLPGLASRVGLADKNLKNDVIAVKRNFTMTLDYNGQSFFRKPKEVRDVARKIYLLLSKLEAVT